MSNCSEPSRRRDYRLYVSIATISTSGPFVSVWRSRDTDTPDCVLILPFLVCRRLVSFPGPWQLRGLDSRRFTTTQPRNAAETRTVVAIKHDTKVCSVHGAWLMGGKSMGEEGHISRSRATWLKICYWLMCVAEKLRSVSVVLSRGFVLACMWCATKAYVKEPKPQLYSARSASGILFCLCSGSIPSGLRGVRC